MDGIDELYAKLTTGRRKPVRDLPEEELRAYGAAAVRAHRRRQRQAIEAGSPEPTVPMIRAALADAALAILALDAPGADKVRSVLGQAFPGRAGVPGTVTAKAKAGTLRPRLLKSRCRPARLCGLRPRPPSSV